MFAAARSASAGERTTVAIAAVDLGPGVPSYLQPKLASQIASGLTAAAYAVKPAAPQGELATCRGGACVTRVADALEVDQLLFASITTAGESPVIDLRLFSARGVRLAEIHEVCDLCGESELLERVGLAASALRARASEPGPADAADATRSKAPGITVIAAGVVVLGGGVALIALDGHGTCSEGDTPVFPDPGAVIRYPDPANHATYVCRESYATKGLGLGGLAVGVASIAIGVALIVRANHHQTVRITPTPGGATVGMTFTW